MQQSPHDAPHGVDSANWCAARQDTCWHAVHVESVAVVSTSAGRRVHAVIQLGGLEPADVRVELTPASGTAAEMQIAGDARMCSTQSYENGAFVFESAPLPVETVPAADWMMRVQARDSRAAQPLEHKFRLAGP